MKRKTKKSKAAGDKWRLARWEVLLTFLALKLPRGRTTPHKQAARIVQTWIRTYVRKAGRVPLEQVMGLRAKGRGRGRSAGELSDRQMRNYLLCDAMGYLVSQRWTIDQAAAGISKISDSPHFITELYQGQLSHKRLTQIYHAEGGKENEAFYKLAPELESASRMEKYLLTLVSKPVGSRHK